MLKYILIIWLLNTTSIGLAQTSIFSVLHLNEEREYKTKRPKKIIETNITYGADTSTYKSIKLFDNAGMLLSEYRNSDGGELETKITYTNDTTRRIILSRVLERVSKLKALNTIETAYFTYDTHNCLIRWEDKKNGYAFYRTEIVNDSKGKPIELQGFDAYGVFSGAETAMYIYGKNRAITSLLNNKGKVISTSSIKISFTVIDSASNNEKYNDKGDLISYNNKEFSNTPTDYEERYEYDEFGNCTSEKIYVVTTKLNGKKRHTLQRVYLRQYFY